MVLNIVLYVVKRFKHLREVRPDASDKLTNKETDI